MVAFATIKQVLVNSFYKGPDSNGMGSVGHTVPVTNTSAAAMHGCMPQNSPKKQAKTGKEEPI